MIADAHKHLEKLQVIADKLVEGKSVAHLALYNHEPFFLHYEGKVVSKERARSTKGHHYTPPATREFELRVKSLASAKMRELGIPRFYRPCIVHLEVIDEMPDDWLWWQHALATNNLIVSTGGGDLDNKEKAILDALNRVVFDDDRQIVQVYKHRRYGDATGFKINIAQTGLTKNDLENIKKFIGNRNAPQDEPT